MGRPRWLRRGDGLLVVFDDQSGRGQLWTVSYPRGEARQLTNDLANYEALIDATPDARTVATLQSKIISNLWSISAKDPSKARQITTGELPTMGVLTTSDGTLVVHGGDGKLWSLNAGGNRRSELAEGAFLGLLLVGRTSSLFRTVTVSTKLSESMTTAPAQRR